MNKVDPQEVLNAAQAMLDALGERGASMLAATSPNREGRDDSDFEGWAYSHAALELEKRLRQMRAPLHELIGLAIEHKRRNEKGSGR